MLSGNGGQNRGLLSGKFILCHGAGTSSSTATQSFQTIGNSVFIGAISLGLLRHYRKTLEQK